MTPPAATRRTPHPAAAEPPGIRSCPLFPALTKFGPPDSLLRRVRRPSAVLLLLLAGLTGCGTAENPTAPTSPAGPTAAERAEIEADLAALAPPKPTEPAAVATPQDTANPPSPPAVATSSDPAGTLPAPTPPTANPPQPSPEPATPAVTTTVPTPASGTSSVAAASVPTARVRPSVIPAGPAVNPLPGGVRVLIPTKAFRPEGRERALRVVFDDLDLLKVLNMEPVTPDAVGLMPDWLRHLNGKTIRLRGFMYPPSFPDGITQFLLARDNQICCFGRNPKPYDIVAVKMKDDVSTHYIENRPFDVIGTFHIEEQAIEDIETFSLYRLDDAIVIER